MELRILNIKVLNYFSDYGYEMTSNRYLKQYRTKKLCQFAENPALVDGISGATISCIALVMSLEEFCDLNDFLLEE